MKAEILAGPERRRRWSEEEKARIVAEAAVPGVRVADIARRRGVSRGLIYIWRREPPGGGDRGRQGLRLLVRLATRVDQGRMRPRPSISGAKEAYPASHDEAYGISREQADAVANLTSKVYLSAVGSKGVDHVPAPAEPAGFHPFLSSARPSVGAAATHL
jgi:transposase-like protein